MKNIFKDAYFGKPYKTRDERKFVYLGEVESLFGHNSAIQGMIEDEDLLTYYNSEGKSLYCEYRGSAINACDIDFNQVNCEEDCETDIISEWQEEEISNEELDKLADDESLWLADTPIQERWYKEGYKEGYRDGNKRIRYDGKQV